MRSAEEAAHHQEQQEIRKDVEQVVELACMGRQLTESQQALLRWATGTQIPVQPKDYSQREMPLGWGGEEF